MRINPFVYAILVLSVFLAVYLCLSIRWPASPW